MEIDNNSFINEYVQVLTTTLDNTLKNSLLLQSKYNVLEKTLNQRAVMDDQIQATVNELTETINKLNLELAESRSEKEFEKAERWRIQEAFNAEMREHAALKSEFSELRSDYEYESDRASRLEQEYVNLKDEIIKLKDDASKKQKKVTANASDSVNVVVTSVETGPIKASPLTRKNWQPEPSTESKINNGF